MTVFAIIVLLAIVLATANVFLLDFVNDRRSRARVLRSVQVSRIGEHTGWGTFTHIDRPFTHERCYCGQVITMFVGDHVECDCGYTVCSKELV